MEKIVDVKPGIPKFSLLAGIGAIAVYLLSSVPFVFVVAFIKVAQEGARNGITSDAQLQETLENLANDPWVLLGALLVQSISLFAYAWLLSFIRGSKNPFKDFGLRFSKSCLWFIPAGIGLQFIGIILSIPLQILRGESDEQSVVSTFRDSSGISFALLLILIGLLVPIAEEICFRGIFQRGLSKKVSPLLAILISGSLFGAVHLADPGAFMGATSLILVGIFAAALAQHRGKIDASICLHVGFNLTTAAILLITR